MRELSQIRQSTLFTEDSPADVSPLAWQETKKGKATTVTSGRNFRGWSESLNHVGSLLKTYLEYCVSQQMTFAPTWSVKATPSGYGILKLRLSARNIDGKGYFLWRTPDANYYRGAMSKETFEKKMKQVMPLSLNDQVAHMLPTPTANDAKTTEVQQITNGTLHP